MNPKVFQAFRQVVEAQDFIMPMRKIGNDLTNTLYRYNANQHLVKVACSVCEAFK